MPKEYDIKSKVTPEAKEAIEAVERGKALQSLTKEAQKLYNDQEKAFDELQLEAKDYLKGKVQNIKQIIDTGGLNKDQIIKIRKMLIECNDSLTNLNAAGEVTDQEILNYNNYLDKVELYLNNLQGV